MTHEHDDFADGDCTRCIREDEYRTSEGHDITCASLLPGADFYHCDCAVSRREGATR